MTVPPFIKSCAVKVLLPGALLAAAIIRPCFLSIGYVLFALLSAIVPPIRKNIALPKVVGTFVTITFLFCLAVALGIGSYQISEQVVHKNDRTYICNRSDTTLFRSIGLVRFHPTGTFESTRAFLPEIIATATALLTFVIVMLLSHRDEQLDVVGDVVTVRSESGREQRRQRKMAAIMWSAIGNSLRRLTNFVIFLFTAYVGIVKPSVSNSVYFGAFLFISTWWATYTPLRHGVYNKIKKFLIFYSAIHFLVLYTYQIPIVHNSWLPTGSFLSRLFGLTVLMDSSCPDWWKFPFVAPDFNDDDLIMKWPLYANPIVVLVFYYLTVSQYKFTKNGSRQYIDDNDYGSSVHEELLSNASSSNEDEQGRARSRSPVRNGEGQNSIPLRKVTSQVVDRNKLSNIFNTPGEQESAASKGMIACMTFVIFHSYSIALTAMMTWALLYHSIFGLILLILTCILWIFRDTRRSSFTMAPLILLYIEFLLCLQYILSFDIHDEIGDPDWMDFVGIKWSTIPVNALIILCVQTLLSLPVFLLLRLARREKYYESLSDFERQRRINSYGTFGASKTGAGGVAVAKDRRVESLLHLWNIYRVDPPEAPSRKDAPARLLSWVDPYKCGAHKAALEIGLSTQRAYEKWQPKSKTRYKICTDPPIDDVRKVATNLRRISGNDRVLFHYNGHGVPKPTDNGEIWVFNKSFTQYIPLSIFDLQGWLDYPTIYIWETHSAETILHNYRRFGEDQKISWQSRFDRWQEEQRNLPPISSKMTDADQAEALGFPEKYPRYNDCIHLAACSAGQWLPMSNPHLPADLFTSCLTAPIRTSLAFHLSHSEHRNEYPENILDMIPGNLAEQRYWIFTVYEDIVKKQTLSDTITRKITYEVRRSENKELTCLMLYAHWFESVRNFVERNRVELEHKKEIMDRALDSFRNDANHVTLNNYSRSVWDLTLSAVTTDCNAYEMVIKHRRVDRRVLMIIPILHRILSTTKMISLRFFSIEFSHEKPAPHQLDHVTTRLVETVPLMFRHRMDYTFYRKDVICDDQIFSVQKQGIEKLMSHFGMIGTLGQVFLPHVEMEVLHAVPVIGEGTVRCRWRVKYVSFLRLLTNPRLLRLDYRVKNLSWFDGYSVLTVDGNGKVFKVTLQKMQQNEQKSLLTSTTEKLKEKLTASTVNT